MIEGLVAIVIVAIVFGTIAGLVLGPIWLKERTKRSAHNLISQALERGQSIDPMLMQRLSELIETQQQRPRKTLGSAVVLLALGFAFAGASFFSGDFDPTDHAWGGMMSVALILGSLGVAFLLLAIVDYVTKKKDS